MKCTQEMNEQNAARAQKEYPGRKYGAVAVTVTSQDLAKKTITVETRGTDEQNHPFTFPIDQVWTECPSTVGKGDDDRRGTLYISKDALQTEADDAPGVRIKGTVPDDSPAILIKWPDSGAAEPHAPLQIWPTDIVITGTAMGNPDYQGQISLMDLRLADLQQAIHFDNGGMITLSLTAAGFAAFGVPMEADLEELRRAVELVGEVGALGPVGEVGALGEAKRLGRPSALELARAVVLIDRWSKLVEKKRVPGHLHEAAESLVGKAHQPARPMTPQLSAPRAPNGVAKQ